MQNTCIVSYAFNFLLSDPVTCIFCGHELVRAAEILTEHSKTCRQVERTNINQTYTCILCNYVTQYRNHMRDHVRKHLGDKPFQCPFCKYRATILSNLTKHIKIKH